MGNDLFIYEGDGCFYYRKSINTVKYHTLIVMVFSHHSHPMIHTIYGKAI